MLKIATHDSATAESCMWWSWFTLIFSRTQCKTIKEQYEAGCRSFDIRVRKSGGVWKCAHGLFVTKRTADDILEEINSFPDRCQVCITYEGEWDDEFPSYAERLRETLDHIIWGYVAVKYGKDSKGVGVKYDILIPGMKGYEGGEQGFLPLDGRSWHTYFPIPWLWDRIYKRPHEFNETKFKYVDFL